MGIVKTTDFETLFDTGKLQLLLADLKMATGAAAAIISLDGTALLGERWSDICRRFYHNHQAAQGACDRNNIGLCGDLIGSDHPIIKECVHGLMCALRAA